MHEIDERVDRPISKETLAGYDGIAPGEIMKYSQLSSFASIVDLLPHDKTSVIILEEEEPDSGHWVAVLRYGDKIEFFNSLGGKPDNDFRYIPISVQHELGESGRDMTRLMDDAKARGFKTVYNKKAFQKQSNSVQTCGRWCAMRIQTMKFWDMSLAEFAQFVKHEESELRMTADETVSDLIS